LQSLPLGEALPSQEERSCAQTPSQETKKRVRSLGLESPVDQKQAKPALALKK